MYYTYDQYLAYRKAKDAVDAFKSIQPTEPTPITKEQVVFDGLTAIPEEAYELYREWEGEVAPCKHPIPYMPNFYKFVKHDIPKDVYTARSFDI